MSSDEITRIKIGNDRVGSIGLKSIISEVAEASKEEYGKAFLREFNKFTGRPFENSGPDGLEIKVLGPAPAVRAATSWSRIRWPAWRK